MNSSIFRIQFEFEYHRKILNSIENKSNRKVIELDSDESNKQLKKPDFLSPGVKKQRIKKEDLINDNVPRVPRTRGSSEVTMTCDTCGKKEQVSKIFARELYKCNKCLLEMGKNGPK